MPSMRALTLLTVTLIPFLILALYFLYADYNALQTREEALRLYNEGIDRLMIEDMDTGCELPTIVPQYPVIRKSNRTKKCDQFDWVWCKGNVCRLKDSVLESATDIECEYTEILRSKSKKYTFGPPVKLKGNVTYYLNKSDYAAVHCQAGGNYTSWKGMVVGLRNIENNSTWKRFKNSPDILVLVLASASRVGFIMHCPKSYKYLTKTLGASILKKYNIVYDGALGAFVPIMTGFSLLELPDVQSTGFHKHNQQNPYLWNKLSSIGYRTAYFEDKYWYSTFLYDFMDFRNAPPDHFLCPAHEYNRDHHRNNTKNDCVGGTKTVKMLMNLTVEYLKANPRSKKLAVLVTSNKEDDVSTRLVSLDEELLNMLTTMKNEGILKKTFVTIVGDPGPDSRRYNERDLYTTITEELLPFASFIAPGRLGYKALENLHGNADVLTTPYDIHNTLLDAIGLEDVFIDVRMPGAKLARSMSLLRKIPTRRSCSEAGIDQRWCACAKWIRLASDSRMYHRVVEASLNHINTLTMLHRTSCAEKKLKSVGSVVQRRTYMKSGDISPQGYVSRNNTLESVLSFKTVITLMPGNSMYEISLKYNLLLDNFFVNPNITIRFDTNEKDFSCISKSAPELKSFCFCIRNETMTTETAVTTSLGVTAEKVNLTCEIPVNVTSTKVTSSVNVSASFV